MRHEPGALVRHAEHPVKLVGAHTLLAGTEQMERQEPPVEWDVAVFHDRADRHRELLPAACALPEALPAMTFGLLVFEIGFEFIGFADYAAVRTDRTIGPAFRFEKLAGFVGILKVRGDDRGVFHTSIIAFWRGFVKYI